MKPETTTRARSEQTRETILQAAINEFAEKGVSGARTETIAAAAGVNKALLHYHFESKDGLYAAVLLKVFEAISKQAVETLEGDGSEGERVLRFALRHFDRFIVHPEYQKLMQQEMIRNKQGESTMLPSLISTYFGPLLKQTSALIDAGIKTGELCKTESLHVIYAIIGTNAFYFMSTQVMGQAAGIDPLAPKAIKGRRDWLMSFLALALFTDRTHGKALAQKVLREIPLPNGGAKPRARRKSL
jgi:TetR/AcrR family transcriptional regulator